MTWKSDFACFVENALNIFPKTLKYFPVFSSVPAFFDDQWWVSAYLSFHTWLSLTVFTSILFLDATEFCGRPDVIAVVTLSRLIAWIVSLHDIHHFVKEDDIILLYLCFSVFLQLQGLSVMFGIVAAGETQTRMMALSQVCFTLMFWRRW